MSDFTCGNFVYFKENDDLSKNHHKMFILNQEPEFNITSPITLPVRLMEEKLKTLKNVCLKILVP